MIRVSTHYGFVAMTTILAVNYFDRFLLSDSFQKDKLWMNQLAAVACLSLAYKVEEIHTHLLLDLQVEGSKYVFESKTTMKMELLVLSCLQWKMKPVTPLAIFDYTMRRLGLITHRLHSEFMNRCERIALAVVNDSRIVEFFKTTDDKNYFRVQWFFRAEDTVMKKVAAILDKKHLFSSTLMNDNLLGCILSKVKIIEKAPGVFKIKDDLTIIPFMA
ncbi:unnamed protein product [Lactuca virosa]|uniref:BAH domain-containing protein n=1 Tax=Lactuca virosa TaxID=75947 RepID=A0AAU9NR91_9ASTR|nr:unnamed protein product [Lactuca virosa]